MRELYAPVDPIQCRQVSSADELRQVYALRHEVFVVEQGVPEELEQDEGDAQAYHVVAGPAHQPPIGVARLVVAEGYAKIGRVAVRAQARGRGVGRVLMEHLEGVARRLGVPEICLDAQTQVVGFYADLGYESFGEPFYDCGILHQRMRRQLSSGGPG